VALTSLLVEFVTHRCTDYISVFYSSTYCSGLDSFIDALGKRTLSGHHTCFHKCCIVNLAEIYFPAFENLHVQCVLFLAMGCGGVVLWGIKQFKAWLGSAVFSLEGLTV